MNDTPSRKKLTAAVVRDTPCPPERDELTLWDSEAPGLGLRIRRSGARTWMFQYRAKGKAARVTIGDTQTWDIAQARKEAQRLKVLVGEGQDPRQVRQDDEAVRQIERDKREAERLARERAKAAASTEERRQAVTLGDLWPRYIEANQGSWGAHHLSDHHKAMQQPGLPRARSKLLTAPGVLWSLHNERLADLTPERLTAWLKHESKTRPTVTAKCYRLLRAFIRWCESERDLAKLCPEGCTSAPKVKKALPKVSAKDDALQREQLAAWFGEVRKIPNPVTAAYLQTALLTGARPEEIAALQWEHVDFRWGSLTLRDKDESKGGLDGWRVIPLTPYVAQLLASLPRRTAWVFSSPTAQSGHIESPNKRHTLAVQAAGLPHLTIHGLRRSFGTLAEWVEAPDGIVKQIQGHKPSGTAEKHYRVRPLDLLRMWHTQIEAWMLEQAGLEQPQSTEAVHGLRRVK